MDQIDKPAPIGEHGERVFRLRRKRVPNPAFRLEFAHQSPAEARNEGPCADGSKGGSDFDGRLFGAAASQFGDDLENGAAGQSMLALGGRFRHCAA